ncbi:ribonuclease pancreatic-like [Emys orbicularis]|uniref:ribonuclease pancreatic-like n=2 Tax=Emydidae TaxID=8476 RepID=UPI0031FD46AC
MALKGMSLICLLFIATSVFSISCAQNPMAFRRKHLTLLDTIDHNTCNSEMRNKRIAMTRDGCKKLNTFIHAREEVIDATCTMGKVHVIKGQKYKKSISKFRVTNCRLSGEYPNDCEYMAEKSAWKYIVISCDQNDRPVHFAGTLNW